MSEHQVDDHLRTCGNSEGAEWRMKWPSPIIRNLLALGSFVAAAFLAYQTTVGGAYLGYVLSVLFLYSSMKFAGLKGESNLVEILLALHGKSVKEANGGGKSPNRSYESEQMELKLVGGSR